MRIPLLLLLASLGGCAPACIPVDEPLTIAVDQTTPSRPIFSWTGEPLREIQVLSCSATPCPAWPSDRTERTPPPGFTANLWHLQGLLGIETGDGAIESPVTFGDNRTGIVSALVAASAPDLPTGTFLVVGWRLFGVGFEAHHSLATAEIVVP